MAFVFTCLEKTRRTLRTRDCAFRDSPVIENLIRSCGSLWTIWKEPVWAALKRIRECLSYSQDRDTRGGGRKCSSPVILDIPTKSILRGRVTREEGSSSPSSLRSLVVASGCGSFGLEVVPEFFTQSGVASGASSCSGHPARMG